MPLQYLRIDRVGGIVLLSALLSLPACSVFHHASSADDPASTQPMGQPTTHGAISVVPRATIFPQATPERIVKVTQDIFPAVVRIDVAQEIYHAGKRTVQRGLGSGVIIDQQGHILTNYHVAGRAVELYVTLANKERVPARLVGDDHWTDLAIIQMDMDVIHKRNISFKHAPLGESNSLVPGQDVIAMGTPFGLTRTLTLGVVSNTERTFYPEKQTIDEYETGQFNNWIQMDTPIAPGNSGGPLVDITGKVVGINTRGIQGQNLNFAIPIDTAKEVIAQILASATPESRGHVDRSYLGIDLKPLQDLETFYNIDINHGVLINSVDRFSPAAKAGVKTQDILLVINGQPTNVRFPEELASVSKQIADLPIKGEVSLSILRNGKPMDLSMTSVRLESAVGEERELKNWGMSIRDVTRAYANEAELDDDLGVVITTLSPGYPGALADLDSGDIIRSINQEPVEDLEAFMKIYEQTVSQRQSRVLLQIKRGRGYRSEVVRLTYAPLPEPATKPAETQPTTTAPAISPATSPASQPATQPTTAPATLPAGVSLTPAVPAGHEKAEPGVQQHMDETNK